MTADRNLADNWIKRHVSSPGWLLVVVASLLFSACSGPYSSLDPAGPSAEAAALLWWVMFAVASAVFVLVLTLYFLSLRKAAASTEDQARRTGRLFILGGGVVLPFAAILLLMIFGVPVGRTMLPVPVAQGEQAIQIHVMGRQWSWVVSYPEHGIALENELHIPAGVPVDVHLTTADVIHAFWVPRLAGKLDTIPGRELVLRIQADEPGIYHGQCAEFCGLNHAHMKFQVHAHDQPGYAQWLSEQGVSQND